MKESETTLEKRLAVTAQPQTGDGSGGEPPRHTGVVATAGESMDPGREARLRAIERLLNTPTRQTQSSELRTTLSRIFSGLNPFKR